MRTWMLVGLVIALGGVGCAESVGASDGGRDGSATATGCAACSVDQICVQTASNACQGRQVRCAPVPVVDGGALPCGSTGAGVDQVDRACEDALCAAAGTVSHQNTTECPWEHGRSAYCQPR